MPVLPPESVFDEPRLQAVAVYLYENFSSPRRLSLTHAARIANLRPETFCRYFHERTGVRFHDWQGALRTERAAQLILNGHSSLQIRAVANQVGYESKSTFSRVFRRYEGIAPTRLRELARRRPDLKPTLRSAHARRLIVHLCEFSENNRQLLWCLRSLADWLEQFGR